MKTNLSALTLLTLGLFATAASSATAAVAPAPDSVHIQLPRPVRIVHPENLPTRFKDATVQLAITIDDAGNATAVKPVGSMDPDLAERLLPVVAQWKFTPMQENGRPVAVRAILPLTLVEGDFSQISEPVQQLASAE